MNTINISELIDNNSIEKNFTIDIDFKVEKAAINGGQIFTNVIDTDFKVEKAAPPEQLL